MEIEQNPPTYVSQAGIAEHYGITSSAVSHWRRMRGFPEPAAYDGDRPLWLLAEVVSWRGPEAGAKVPISPKPTPEAPD